MSIAEDLKKVSANEIAFAITGFLSSVAPGFLILYLFKPSLVVSLDSFKLVLFALALTLPVISINFLAIAAAHPFLTKGAQSQIPNDSDRGQALINAMSASIFVLYPSIGLVFGFGLSFKTFLLIIAAMQFLMLMLLYAVFRAAKKRNPYLCDPFGISNRNENLACSKCGTALSLVGASKGRDGRPVVTCPTCGHKETIIITATFTLNNENHP